MKKKIAAMMNNGSKILLKMRFLYLKILRLKNLEDENYLKS